jgi:Protein of unknown function (DUF1592)/Protein of unknown function (DUF1588)/Protein of unknown function (DUF1587)/Protein of unknown function (DUF1585)/Protein of unknown function (DUF1595)/Planctomycete cytochrome C
MSLRRWSLIGVALCLLGLTIAGAGGADGPPPVEPKDEYASTVQPLVKRYCLACHSTKVKKGDLDLERFASLDQVRKDVKPWQAMIEMLESGEMPPKSKPQPTAEERKRLLGWVHGFVAAEARARAGDPGPALLRRLSNAEYTFTIRDLTGVDLQPAREFPADGAAGEGFTNASEALSLSPALLDKYLAAAKDVADHAVFLPDGFGFSSAKTRRDWTNESLARLRAFYAGYTSDGRLPLAPYLTAAVRHRDELIAGKITLGAVADKEKLNPKYLGILWRTLTDERPSFPLDQLRASWRRASEKDVPALLAGISAWQGVLWKFVPIGSYVNGNMVRQVANDPATVETQTLKLSLKPAPGQSEVVLYLVTGELPTTSKDGYAVWQRPRFEGVNKPTLLLRDYAKFGPQYEVDYAAVFADSAKYLAAAVEAANDRKLSADDLAKKHVLDVALMKRWIDVLAVAGGAPGAEDPGREVPAVALELLGEKSPKNDQKPAINGWRKKGADLPVIVTNSSDKVENVPGRVSPHRVTVHPTPTEFVAAVWKSPLDGTVRVAAKVAHAHPACGNGIAWWLEHRRGDRAAVLAEGAVKVGGEAQVAPRGLKVAKGDLLFLAIDARDGDHSCDLTEITLTVTETEKPGRVWDLADDVADSVLEGNPHADKHGNKEVWSYVKGPARPAGSFTASGPPIPPDSILGRWRRLAADPAKREEAGKLAAQLTALLTGARPGREKDPDRILYDNLVSLDGPLFRGLDLARMPKPRPGTSKYGLEKAAFGRHPLGKPADAESLIVAANGVTEVRLPAALFRDREFVVEGRLDPAGGDRAVQFRVLTAPPTPAAAWDGKTSVVAPPASAARKQLLDGFTAFRNCFPQFICYPRIIPDDEVVCLKLYHREDEPLVRLFLDDEQTRRLDRLWLEHRFITQWPVTEHKNLPLFIGFVTQDQPKALVTYFEGLREPFRKRAEEFEKEVEAAVPKQMEQLLDFAARAYRRPLRDGEKADLLGLHAALRKKGISQEEAFRAVLARVLVSPSFLFHLEQSLPGKEPQPVNDSELAARLSYFLWSSVPDEELRRSAAAGQLHDPKVLERQTQRMLKDQRVRALAIEFGTQWIHVRGFDELKEKNEKLFPTFDDKLRKAINEEAILFFQDLFQADQPVTRVLDADYTFLDETLAKHYGIPGVVGPEWRKVEGVRKYGRGGILGLAAVQAKESGASRTSPVLRGNWVVETLLGEKLPRPPANVPRLPEEEGGSDGLTMRQLVEKHTRVAECAVCHQRIDPFGFALEKYDPIGRLRTKDFGGLALDSRSKLRDGTEFEGIDGLRDYLLTKKKDVIVRLICRRLLGYALGRSVVLADQPLIDEMAAGLNGKDGRLSAAVLAIVRSPQFRSIRGSDFTENIP